jgi:hypothetical protein
MTLKKKLIEKETNVSLLFFKKPKNIIIEKKKKDFKHKKQKYRVIICGFLYRL